MTLADHGGGSAGHGDLLQRPTREERDPRSIGREHQVPRALGSRQSPELQLVERANVDTVRALVAPDIRQGAAIRRNRDLGIVDVG